MDLRVNHKISAKRIDTNETQFHRRLIQPLIQKGKENGFATQEIKVTILQSLVCNSPMECAKILDTELTKTVQEESRKPDFVILPENWIHGNGIVSVEENPFLKELSYVVKKYGVYALLGTFVETADEDRRYVTCVLMNPDGTINGSYRKRKPTIEGAHDKGNKVGIFDTAFGKVAIMICFDIENEDIFLETLKHKPKILFNPTFIPAPSSIKTEDQLLSDWKIGMESMSHKFERICNLEGLTIIRCDVSNQNLALGSSQVIGPFSTLYTPSFRIHNFSCIVNNLHTNDFSKYTVSPTISRTNLRDNTGNRYSINLYVGHSASIYKVKFVDQMQTVTISEDKTLKIWNMHTTKCLHSSSFPNPFIDCLLFRSNQQLFALGSNFTLHGLDLKKNAQTIFEKALSFPVHSMISTFSGNNIILSKGDNKQGLYLFDTNSSNEKFLNAESESLITSFLWLDEFHLCGGSENGNISIWDCRTWKKCVQTRQIHSAKVSCIRKLNEEFFLSCDQNGEISKWSKKMILEDLIETIHCEKINSPIPITDLAVINLDKFLLAGSDGLIHLCKVSNSPSSFEKLHTLYGHFQMIHSLDVESNRIASCGEEIEWKLWKFTQHRNPITLSKFFEL